MPPVLIGLLVALIVFTDAGSLPMDRRALIYFVLLVPITGLGYWYGLIRRRRAMRRFALPQTAALLAAGVSPGRQALRAGMVLLALFLVIIALLGPRWGKYLEKREAYGVDVVVAMDVSRSMLARDLKPNRLEYAKGQLRIHLTERSAFANSNRLGLLAFAGSASMKAPLSLDHLFFQQALANININSAPRGGTAIAEAIYDSVGFFRSSPDEAMKILLVVTDGEDHEGGPVKAAEDVYNDYGIVTYTVGVGDPDSPVGAEVPSAPGPGAKPLVYDGQLVISKLEDKQLREIADSGQGKYVSIRDLGSLVNQLSDLQQQRLTTEERLRNRPRYQWFLAPAILLLLLEPMVRDRRRNGQTELERTWQQEMAG